jgi:nickel-dependent lactate racemase
MYIFYIMSTEEKPRKGGRESGSTTMHIFEKNLDRGIQQDELELLVERTIEGSGALGARRILIIPPDITRLHSRAGQITDLLVAKLGPRMAAIMPALGTHSQMTEAEIARMYPGSPQALFRVHDWRRDVAELGRIPEARVGEISGGKVRYSYPVQANRLLSSGEIDFIFSVGQVVPHEVAGMANHAKNIFVGTGGKEAIDRSHYLGAVCGMEGIMGRANTPVRALFDEALGMAAGKVPPIAWILTVIGSAEDGSLALRGYFSSLDRRCFEEASALSAQVNIQLLERPVQKAVVWLDPEEYRSTWLGNKAIYRMRMAMADGGELLILAPGLRSFGEDPNIDAVIRRYGYRPSAEIQSLVAREPALAGNLSAAAHLIHGSSEGRFRISYAPGPSVGREEIASVGYQWADLDRALERYSPRGRLAGFHTTADGEDFFFVPNPALGLWSTAGRMRGA